MDLDLTRSAAVTEQAHIARSCACAQAVAPDPSRA